MPASVQFPTPLLTPTVYEGNTVVATPVFLRGFTGGVVTVDYTTIDETAIAGTDYQATSGVLTFAPGQTSQPIDVPILGSIGDPDNAFQVVLSNPSGAALAIPVQTITFTVANPVTLSSPGVQSNYDGDTVSLPVSASDGLGNPLTFSDVVAGADTLPPGLSIDPNTGIISGTIASNADQGGPYTVTITAADATAGVSAIQTFEWAVAQPTVTLTSPGDQNNYDGDSVSLTVSASEDAGHALAFSATGLPAGVSINSSTGVISGTIGSNADQSGPYAVTLTAADAAAGASASVSFMWNVTNPVGLTNPGDQSFFDGDSVWLQLSASDADGNALTYAVTSGTPPAGLSLDSDAGIISGTIASGADAGGPYAVTVSATDVATGASVSQGFAFDVAAPTVVLLGPGDGMSLPGLPVSIGVPASDTAGHSLAFSATNLPAGVTIDSSSGAITGTIPTSAISTTPYAVTVTATDAAADVSSTVSFDWTVIQLTLSNPGRQRNVTGDAVDLALSATDALGNPVSFSATGLPDGLSIDPDTGEISGTIADDAAATSAYQVAVTASDGTASATQSFAWTVGQIVLKSPGGQYSTAGATISLAVTASAADGDPITFAATGLPSGLTIDPNSGVISGVISAGTVGSSTVVLSVTDTATGATATRTFTWTVGAAIDPTWSPTELADPANVLDLPNPGDQTNCIGDGVSVQAGVMSPTEDAVAYQALDLPPGLAINDSGAITGTIAANADTGASYAVTVIATEAGTGATASQTFNWFVGTAATAAAPGYIQVTLPTSAAQVFIDGAATTSTGTSRTYQTPPLQGAAFYTVRATYEAGGVTVVDERQVRVTPNNTTDVAFTQATSTLRVSARILVVLPTAAAIVTIDGVTRTSTGATRYYDTPALEVGSTYSYTLVVTWTNTAGQTQTVQQRVTVTPGRITRVDLSQPATIADSAPGAQSAAVNYRIIWTGSTYSLEAQNNDGGWSVMWSGAPGISRDYPIEIDDPSFTLQAPNLEGLWIDWQGELLRVIRGRDGSLTWVRIRDSFQGGPGPYQRALNQLPGVPPPPGPVPENYLQPGPEYRFGFIMGAAEPGVHLRSGFGIIYQQVIPPLYQQPPFRWIYAPLGWRPPQ